MQICVARRSEADSGGPEALGPLLVADVDTRLEVRRRAWSRVGVKRGRLASKNTCRDHLLRRVLETALLIWTLAQTQRIRCGRCPLGGHLNRPPLRSRPRGGREEKGTWPRTGPSLSHRSARSLNRGKIRSWAPGGSRTLCAARPRAHQRARLHNSGRGEAGPGAHR